MEAPDTIRVLFIVHYDGSDFSGWQVQPDQRTVQGTLQETLGRLANRPISVFGAGRTDSGVHATGQAAAADVPRSWTPVELRRALNATLPPDVWIESAKAVGPRFHPRYDAVARTYTYKIGTDPQAASPFHRRWCWPLADRLDSAMLADAASVILGEHSFLAFAKAGQPERGERCAVTSADWSRWSLGPLFTITADRYLHHMVRYLVGTMVDIARGRRPASDLSDMLANDPALTTSAPAPAEGLFLTHVEYPDDVALEHEPPQHERSGAKA